MLKKTDLKLTEDERLYSSLISFIRSYCPRYLLILSFVLCLFLSFSFASAEGMPSFASAPLDEYLSEHNFPSNYQSWYNTAKTETQFYLSYQVGSFYYLIMSPYEYIFEPRSTSNAWYPGGSSFTGVYNGSFSQEYIGASVSTSGWSGFAYTFVWYSTGSLVRVYKYTLTGKSGSASYNGRTVYSCYSNQQTLYSSSWSTSSNQAVSNIICYGNMWIDTSGVLKAQSTTIPLYSVDDRLKLYTTQSSSQGSLLHVDLSEFYQYNNGVSSNFSFSDVVLTLDCDGVEKSFTLSPSGTQYEFLDTSTSSSRIYGYIVPYTFFSVSEYQNCSVVKVDFSRTISSPGGSGSEDFKISCDYRLKMTNINGNAQDFTPVTLVPVPSVTVSPDQSIVQDWSDNTSYKSSSFGHNGSYILLNSLPIFPDWVDKYTLDCTRVNKTVDGVTLNLWIDLDNPYVSVNTALIDIPITAFFTPESYLKDNVLTDFYDVVVFKVWSDTGKTSVDGYLYFYTEKYDLKYQNNLIVQELGLEYDSLNLLSSGFSLIRTGLDNIDNNSAAFFTDSLFNDTVVISWLQTLNNTNAFGFTDVINAIEDIPQYDDSSVVSGIASVVSAIEGIDSPDLSDLESKLDSLINFFVADGSTENASSRNYRNWLRGIDDESARTVTYYADNVFSIVHDMFDLFDADGSVYYPPDSQDVVSTDYINLVKLFIEKMNSSTITNTEYNKFLRGFFQAGYDPHLIDGGL